MNNAEPRLYLYKMTTDNGGAPCVRGPLLSLAICKPVIRRCANPGSIVFGFGAKGNEKLAGRLIYIAVVSEKLARGEYYKNPRYQRRPDCIYKSLKGKAVRKAEARFHAESKHLKKDVGLRFERGHVLLSKEFRYFGRADAKEFDESYKEIKKLLDGPGRSHRVNHSPELRAELLELKNKIWKRYRKRMIGNPTDADRSRPCNDGGTAEC